MMRITALVFWTCRGLVPLSPCLRQRRERSCLYMALKPSALPYLTMPKWMPLISLSL
jgi:hypothetical protein